MAEFDNFRKRTEKEKSSMYIIGAKDIVEKMLPVVDNFERGLAQAPEGDSFADGMKMIYKQLITTLDELGVKPIEAVGKEFDPNFHNAVMHVEDEEAGENIVVEEFPEGLHLQGFRSTPQYGKGCELTDNKLYFNRYRLKQEEKTHGKDYWY